MFKAVTETRKRPFWSSRTVAASVGVHLLLLAGFVSADEPKGRPTGCWFPEEPPIIWIAEGDEPRHARGVVTPAAPQRQPPPAQVNEPKSALEFPDEVPGDVGDVDARAEPVTEATVGAGSPLGGATGFPGLGPALPAGNTQPADSLQRWVPPFTPDAVDTQPELANKRQAEMALRRAYPPRLRDGGIAGRTTVMLIIDKDGNVEPGSVRVQDSTHDAFEEAAVRAVERFRFKPATLRGHPVAVLVTLPISWELEN
ncbi:MAG TPA: energy transducer TonB [Longimicrobium sp.]|nr:energy transducer TonB [Longimicrobium sp.]